MSRKFLANINLNGNEIQNVLVHLLAADPGSPVEGQAWYNTTAHVLRYYNGTTTIDLTTGGAVAASAVTVNSATLVGVGTDAQAVFEELDDAIVAAVAGAQPLDSDLTTIAGLTATTDNFIQAKASAWASRTVAQVVTDLVAGGLAPLASPALTGNPTAPTATLGDNDTSVATTAFVAAAIAALVNGAPGTLDTLEEIADALGDDANLASTLTTSIATKAGKFSQTIVGGGTTEVITHNLGTRAVIVSVHDVSTFVEVVCDVTKTSTNTITIGFAVAPAAGAYVVTVHG